jgi:hypothetical protein
MNATFILYILAAICFFVAAINVTWPRVNLIALGLLFWVLAYIIGGPHVVR